MHCGKQNLVLLAKAKKYFFLILKLVFLAVIKYSPEEVSILSPARGGGLAPLGHEATVCVTP